jgi:hypothetical protein
VVSPETLIRAGLSPRPRRSISKGGSDAMVSGQEASAVSIKWRERGPGEVIAGLMTSSNQVALSVAGASRFC